MGLKDIVNGIVSDTHFPVAALLTLTIVSYLGASMYRGVKEQNINTVMIKYSDRNNNGIVSDNENDYFRNHIYSKILSEHDAVLVDDEVMYKNGGYVAIPTLSNWLKDYDSSNQKNN